MLIKKKLKDNRGIKLLSIVFIPTLFYITLCPRWSWDILLTTI